MKTNKIIYWTATVLIFLFEGVMPAIFSQSQAAKEGIQHLGYPEYFGNGILVVFKILGAIILIVPTFKGRIKEWAYAGFTFIFLSATISHAVIDGWINTIAPVIALVVLALSYIYYHKINSVKLK